MLTGFIGTAAGGGGVSLLFLTLGGFPIHVAIATNRVAPLGKAIGGIAYFHKAQKLR